TVRERFIRNMRLYYVVDRFAVTSVVTGAPSWPVRVIFIFISSPFTALLYCQPKTTTGGSPLGVSRPIGAVGAIGLGGGPLRDHFIGHGRAILTVAGDLQLQFVAAHHAFILRDHRIAIHLPFYGERDGVAVDLAVANRDRVAAAAAAARGHGAGQCAAIDLQGDGYGTAGVAAPAGLFKGPLAGNVRRQQREGRDKQNRHYKKQLFGHSTRYGAFLRPDVTGPGGARASLAFHEVRQLATAGRIRRFIALI